VRIESKRSGDRVVDLIGIQPLSKHAGCLVYLRDSHKELVSPSERCIYGSVRGTHASDDSTIRPHLLEYCQFERAWPNHAATEGLTNAKSKEEYPSVYSAPEVLAAGSPWSMRSSACFALRRNPSS